MTARSKTALSLSLALAFALAGAASLAAQAQPADAMPSPDATVEAEQGLEADDGGLTGSVSADGAWQDLGIAITTFATDADVPTSTNAGSTAALGRALHDGVVDLPDGTFAARTFLR